jgi:hypothetical protein
MSPYDTSLLVSYFGRQKFLKGFCPLASFFLALAYAVKKLFLFLTKCKHTAKTEVSFGFLISY